MQRELLTQAALDTVTARATAPTEDEVLAFFAANPDRFHLPERRVVRHLLITVNPDFPDNTDEAAHARAGALVEALKGGASFADLAAHHSECPTAMQGGAVGTVPRGVLYPEVEALAFSLAPGGAGAVRRGPRWVGTWSPATRCCRPRKRPSRWPSRRSART